MHFSEPPTKVGFRVCLGSRANAGIVVVPNEEKA